MPVLGELNKRAILIEEVREAVNEMKLGMAPGVYIFPVECLQKGYLAVLEWLVRLLNASFYKRIVPIDWRDACTYSAPVQREGWQELM